LMVARCGLVEPTNACRCSRRVKTAIEQSRIDPDHLLFASAVEQSRRFPAVVAEIRKLDKTRRAAALYRSHPIPKPNDSFGTWLREVLDTRIAPTVPE
jgi:hypothetical protein